MNRFRNVMKNTVRPIALALVFTVPGFALRQLLKVFLDVEIPLLIASIFNFALAALGAFVIFPKGLKQPFGKVDLSDYVRRLGLYLPPNAWKHVGLGLVLALCTLGGMLVASILTGRYVLDWSTIELSHIVFSLNPGVWEEIFFRGIIMAVLLKKAKSVRRAALIQIVIFGLIHVKGIDAWSWFDAISVMVITSAFTYSAYKTRTLLAGIVFHFFHDALLFFVQVPDGEYFGFAENMTFYVALWISVGLACMIAKGAVEKFGVQGQDELYRVE